MNKLNLKCKELSVFVKLIFKLNCSSWEASTGGASALEFFIINFFWWENSPEVFFSRCFRITRNFISFTLLEMNYWCMDGRVDSMNKSLPCVASSLHRAWAMENSLEINWFGENAWGENNKIVDEMDGADNWWENSFGNILLSSRNWFCNLKNVERLKLHSRIL